MLTPHLRPRPTWPFRQPRSTRPACVAMHPETPIACASNRRRANSRRARSIRAGHPVPCKLALTSPSINGASRIVTRTTIGGRAPPRSAAQVAEERDEIMERPARKLTVRRHRRCRPAQDPRDRRPRQATADAAQVRSRTVVPGRADAMARQASRLRGDTAAGHELPSARVGKPGRHSDLKAAPRTATDIGTLEVTATPKP